MSKQHWTNWQLFVDESGDFDDPSDVLVVGGLLVRADAHSDQRAALRAALGDVFPGVAYPPHASLLNIPAGRLYAALASAGQGVELPEGLAPVLERARDVLGKAEGQWVDAWRHALRAGRPPKYTVVRQCDGWLRRRAAVVHARLRALVAADRRRMCRLLEQSPRLFGTEEAVVIGASVYPPAAAVDEHHDPDLDRYLSLLAVMIERAFAILRGDEDRQSHRVWLQIASRRVPFGPAGMPVPMRLQDVGRAVHRAASFPFHASAGPGDERVRVLARALPEPYDASVHPGIVLADYIVNRLRWCVLDAGTRHPWTSLSDRARALLALRPEAVARAFRERGPLPILAEGERAQRAIRRAFAGEVPGARAALGPVRRRWAVDQAMRWIELAASPEGTS